MSIVRNIHFNQEHTRNFVFYDGDNLPVDLTSATEVQLTYYVFSYPRRRYARLILGDGLTLIDAENGVIQVHFTAGNFTGVRGYYTGKFSFRDTNGDLYETPAPLYRVV